MKMEDYAGNTANKGYFEEEASDGESRRIADKELPSENERVAGEILDYIVQLAVRYDQEEMQLGQVGGQRNGRLFFPRMGWKPQGIADVAVVEKGTSEAAEHGRFLYLKVDESVEPKAADLLRSPADTRTAYEIISEALSRPRMQQILVKAGLLPIVHIDFANGGGGLDGGLGYLHVETLDRIREDSKDLVHRVSDVWAPYRLRKPKDYEEPKAYPKFEVANVISGAGTVAPNLWERFSFDHEAAARAYIEAARRAGFKGNIQLAKMETESHGKILEEIEVA